MDRRINSEHGTEHNQPPGHRDHRGNPRHDRDLFIDGRQGYLSSASFKDGGKNAPAQLTEVHDAFAQILSIYKEKWEAAEVLD